MNLSKPREIAYAEIEDLFERLDKTVETEMEEVGVQYPEAYKAGYYASMVRMMAWNNPEAYAWLQDFVKHYETKPRIRARAA